MSDPTRPYSAEHIADLRTYHNPCGWSCASSVDGTDCKAARWLATLDAALSTTPAPLVYERVIKALDSLDVIDGIVDDTHPEGDGCPLCHELDNLREVLDALRSTP